MADIHLPKVILVARLFAGKEDDGAIPPLENDSRWIEIEHGRPDCRFASEVIWIKNIRGIIRKGFYCVSPPGWVDRHKDESIDNVSHWMPLKKEK